MYQSLEGKRYAALVGVRLEDTPLMWFGEDGLRIFQYWSKEVPSELLGHGSSGEHVTVFSHSTRLSKRYQTTEEEATWLKCVCLPKSKPCKYNGEVTVDNHLTIWRACTYCSSKVGETHSEIHFFGSVYAHLFQLEAILAEPIAGCVQCFDRADFSAPWPEGGFLCTKCEAEATRLENRPQACCVFAIEANVHAEDNNTLYICNEHGRTDVQPKDERADAQAMGKPGVS